MENFLISPLVDTNFEDFETKKDLNLFFVCMTQYDETMPNVKVAFKPTTLVNTFGEYISNKGLTQLRIAETEKYAHVTFFFNGGEEKQYPGEDRILVPSPKVATYDLQPEMSAYEVTDKVIEAINSDKYNVIILNYANPDMVGHTGNLEAAIKALETIDECVGKVVDAVQKNNGTLLITADHGVTSSNTMSPTPSSLFRMAPWIAAPTATTSSGLTPLEGSLPK